MTNKKTIEVESGEIAIRNSHNDIAIIPKDLKLKIENLIKLKDFKSVDDIVKGLPKFEDYAEDGSLIPAEKKLKSAPINETPIVFDKNVKNYGQFFMDDNQRRSKSNEYTKIHVNSNPNDPSHPSCAAGAFNCNINEVAPYLGQKGIREIIQEKVPDVKNSPYAIKSDTENPISKKDYAPNQSIDSWEIAEAMTKSGAGKYFGVEGGIFTKGSNHDKEKIKSYKKLPIGSIVLFGDARTTYISPNEKPSERHTTTVVGYDPKDGEPLIYDYGELRRLDNNKFGSVSRAIVPNGYEKYTYDNMNAELTQYKKSLGYTENYKPRLESKYRKEINSANNSIEEVIPDVGVEYGINYQVSQKLKNKVLAIGMQETAYGGKFADEAGLEGMTKAKIALVDNTMVGRGIKSLGKSMLNTKKSIVDTADKIDNSLMDVINNEKMYPDQMYKYEMKLDKKFENLDFDAPENKKFKERLEEIKKIKYSTRDAESATESAKLDLKQELLRKDLKKVNQKKEEEGSNKEYDTRSSLGQMSIKNIPEFSKKKWGIDENSLTGNNTESLKNSSKAAYTYLAENYNKFRKTYPSLNEEELVELSVVSYNNGSKPLDKEFVDFYIKNKKGTDDYASKIKQQEEEIFVKGKYNKIKSKIFANQFE